MVAALWPGCWFGLEVGAPAVVGAVGAAGVILIGAGRRRWATAVAVAVIAGTLAGAGAHAGHQRNLRSLSGADGPIRLLATVSLDPAATRFGSRMVVVPRALDAGGRLRAWRGPPLAVQSDDIPSVEFGDLVWVTGRLRAGAGRVGRLDVAGRVSATEITPAPFSGPALVGFSNALRHRVLSRLDSDDPGQALLAGFLVGDTSGVGRADLEALRRAGLSHFVAVSGSNVATFLALWWLVLAPLSRNPVPRALAGLVGVAVFVVVTRAEPSVVRAGIMVAVLLVGRLLGLAFDRWATLGLTVIVCLALAPGLAADVGFQLSVAATGGVMAGMRRFRFSPQAVADVLGATVSAQVAVAPILLWTFGSIPLMAPLANLAAAPMVAFATAVGGVGALTGIDWLVAPADLASEVVLAIGRISAPWPQIGPLAFGLAVACALLAWRLPAVRPAVAVVCGLVATLAVAPLGPRVEPGTVVFLDVGQGDASLVLGEDLTVLIDGGPDPGLLSEKLADWGVDRIDLLIVSHVHADHVEGLRAVVGRMPVGAAWFAFDHQSTPASEWLRTAVSDAGIPADAPPTGTELTRGEIGLEVLGPLRRYASPNDQSLVVEVSISGRSVLFTGDVEVIAQRELDGLTADVLKVPHQGAATSDPEWLQAVGADLAVISVGPNDFGHPAEWVVELLERSGATVLRTDRNGDVVLGPGGLESRRPWWRLWP